MPVTKLTPTFNLEQERIEALKQLIPEAVSDGKIDWAVLKEALGEFAEEEGAEHFGLSWAGKREARRLAVTPSQGTLVPALGEGIDEDTTKNLFIEGDNLEVLKLLQKSYAGKVKLIYIDPPYNTGNDFIYKDDYSEPTEDYLRKTKQTDEAGKLLTTNPKTSGRFHSNWLSMMYPRLRLAKNLLRDDGVIFVSIDDNEVHNLRHLMNEIFGEENFIANVIWEGGLKNDSKFFSESHDYILCYCLNKDYLIQNKIIWRTRKENIDLIYSYVEQLKKKYGNHFNLISKELQQWYRSNGKNHPTWQHRHYKNVDAKGVFFTSDISWPGGGGPQYTIYHPVTKRPVKRPSRGWVFPTEEKMLEMIKEDKVFFGNDENTVPTLKTYLHETEGQVLPSVFYKDRRASMQKVRDLFEGQNVFESPKDTDIIKKLIEATSSSESLILDFFSGSSTTAHAVLELNKEDGGNRRFIMVQIPEETNNPEYPTIAEIGKERIRRVIKKIKEEQAEAQGEPQDLGFKVYKLDRSNLKIWKDYKGDDVQALQTQLFEHENRLVEGWTEPKVITELQLLEGFPLDSKVELVPDFQNDRVFCVSHADIEHRLFICLAPKLHINTIQDVRLLPEEDAFICLDTALDDRGKLMLADSPCNVKTI